MFERYKQRKAELEKERALLENAIKEAETVNKETKAINKETKALKKTIEAYKKQSAVLLLEDLDEDLVKKLQSLTEDNIIILFCKDGTRVEIKANETKYKRNTGRLS